LSYFIFSKVAQTAKMVKSGHPAAMLSYSMAKKVLKRERERERERVREREKEENCLKFAEFADFCKIECLV
jgi:hypothetical protein